MTYTYHQHASGEFSVDVVPGTKHCGINDNRGQFKYQVDIVGFHPTGYATGEGYCPACDGVTK